MTGLELPRVAGISVAVGDPLDLDQLRGQQHADADARPTGASCRCPDLPEEC